MGSLIRTVATSTMSAVATCSAQSSVSVAYASIVARCRMTDATRWAIYEKASLAGMNSAIGLVRHATESSAKCLGIWATRDIAPGEELFVHYGAACWLKMATLFSELGLTSPAERQDKAHLVQAPCLGKCSGTMEDAAIDLSSMD